MYDRLTPLGRNVSRTSAHAQRRTARGYFKSRALLAADDPSFITDETVSGTVRGTDAHARASGATPTASRTSTPTPTTASCSARATSLAEDRNLLLDQARDNGIAGGDRPAGRARDRRWSAGSTPTSRRKAVGAEVTRQQDARAAQAAGRDGAPGAARHRHLPRGHQPLVRARTAADARPFDARRHLRAERDQGAVPRARAAATRSHNALFLDAAARRARRQARHRGLRGPAPAQRPGDVDDDAPRGAAPDRRSRSTARAGSCGSSRARSSRPASPLPGAGASGRRGRRPPQGVQRPARHRAPLRDRHADLRRRPADRLTTTPA